MDAIRGPSVIDGEGFENDEGQIQSLGLSDGVLQCVIPACATCGRHRIEDESGVIRRVLGAKGPNSQVHVSRQVVTSAFVKR